MIKIKEVIVVEGRYDKNKLAQIVDTTIIETSGFGIFNNSEKRALLKKLCESRGVVILTDSDGAGFVIRNHLRGILPKEKVVHAYIPQIEGKEKRKTQVSKEGLLGVEGVSDEVIIDALKRSGVTFLDSFNENTDKKLITKTDFYDDGLSGKPYSSKLRIAILSECDLPKQMTANAMLEALNILLTYEDYKKLARKMKKILHFDAEMNKL